jgi:phosphoribosylamine-glycine ligase
MATLQNPSRNNSSRNLSCSNREQYRRLEVSVGVFNVEMKMTKTGPNLIEINARMGGFYLRNWILTCYGIALLLSDSVTAILQKGSSSSSLQQSSNDASIWLY